MKKCERCGKAATSRISSITNGKREEHHYCHECFAKMTPFGSIVMPAIMQEMRRNDEFDDTELDENGVPYEYSSMDEGSCDCDTCGIPPQEILEGLEDLLMSFEEVLGEAVPKLINENPPKQAKATKTLLCSGCGISIEEVSKKQRAGCAKCYQTFGDVLLGRSKNLTDGRAYSGKNYSPKIILSDYDHLQKELSIAVENQNYELAAHLRDSMKSLKNKVPI